MTKPASLQITRDGRSPPVRTRSIQIETPSEPLSLSESIREIERAMSAIKRWDELMTTLEQAIDRYQSDIDSADEWDRIDGQSRIELLENQQAEAGGFVLMETNAVIFHGGRLIDAWRDTDLDNIARKHSQTDRLFSRVQSEWPAVAKNPV